MLPYMHALVNSCTGVHLDAFQACVDNTKLKLYYNGDITSVAKFHEMQARFPSIEHWMIGRINF
jgi:tRNA-dihydrouridine synthase